MKKTIVFLFVFCLVLLTGCVFNQNTNQPINQPIVGGDKDVHGCIGSAGYRWCEASQKCLRIWEEGCADDIVSLFNDLKKTTQINFGEIITNTVLTWMVNSDNQPLEYKLPAYEMSATEIKPEDIAKVYNFFLTNGFEKDANNQTVKSIAGHSIGYSYAGGSLVCGVGDQEQSLAVYCATWNLSQTISSTDKQEIIQLFAQKYNKKIEEITITINQKTENHIRGGVKFGLGGVGEGGIFLAAKIDGKWQLAFDGNGGSFNCQELKDMYHFPDEILKPNFCN
jgi:hypothetical protein